ncbi:TetR/AcrR family transcriptional regulator [Dactylosporangium sp. AC04546]|uniref:TetR/AcrR family transcriptional regulator n=1 Tax=Dactylosporangium sp. AC04546 TaxID=2862460 RepID=UPI001EDD6177|nr:TetR/AcrR family transcriptional regulator [Dactylosporangium sp. AC04546]WVK87121.1 TetR/AcrR family transcriptional regulator [Dactylosporangium sp. AC04546]
MTTRAEQREETRRALLAEGWQRFARDGYHAVVLEELARGIGATKGAAYHHFGSKAGLFRAVVAEAQERIGAGVAAAAEEYDDPWDQLLAGCRAFLAAGSDAEFQRIVLLDAPTVLGWNEWRAMDEASSARHLGEALSAVMAAGVIAPQPVEPLARLLSGAMNEAALWIAGTPDPAASVDAAMDALTSLLDGLRS